MLTVCEQVKECSRLAQEAVRDGMCVVIGLQSTGEANTSSERSLKGDELDDFVSVRKQPYKSKQQELVMVGLGCMLYEEASIQASAALPWRFCSAQLRACSVVC